MHPLVTVIIPTFNREHLIIDTLSSLSAQKYQDWEAIIVDDGSTDATKERIQQYIVGEPRIKLFERDRGPKGASVCRNIGLGKAAGEYIIFLDSDDILAPWCIEQRVECMINNPALDFAVFHAKTFKKDIEDGEVHTRLNYQNHLYHFIASHCIWQTMCPVWKKNFVIRIGGFDENHQRFQDAEFHTKALLHDGVCYKVFNNLMHDCYFRMEHENRSKEFWSKVTDAYIYYTQQIIQINSKKLNTDLFTKAFGALNYFGIIYCLRSRQNKAEDVLKLIKLSQIKNSISTIQYCIFCSALYLFRYSLLQVSFFRKICIRILAYLCFRKIKMIG